MEKLLSLVSTVKMLLIKETIREQHLNRLKSLKDKNILEF